MSQMEPQGDRRRQFFWRFACALLAIASIISFVPLDPKMPADSLDPSWALGMSYGVEHGFSIGKDLIFTFGPLANIYTGMYSKSFDITYLAISLYISVVIFIGLYSVFCDKKRFIPLTICALTILIMGGHKDAFFMLIPALTSLALISSLISFDNISRHRLLLIAFCIPSLGLLPLIKLSLSALCILCICINFGVLVYKRKIAWMTLYTALPLISFFSAWTAFGQSIGTIKDYILNAKPIISGYTEAMAVHGSAIIPIAFIIGCAILGKNLTESRMPKRTLSWAVILVVTAYLFIAFKAGFVRDDGHALMSGIALLMISMISWPFIQSLKGLGTVCATSLISIFVIGYNTSVTPASIADSAYTKVAQAYTGFKVRLLDPDANQQNFEEHLNSIADNSNFPKLEGSTDVYSYDQAPLIASGAQWTPRPIFQSYSAYTPELINKNAEHLRNVSGAQNVVFSVAPIDKRMPTIEDGASWPVLYSQYKLVNLTGKYAVLKRKSDIVENLTPLEKREVLLGDTFNIPPFDDQVYMTAKIDPTFIGRLRSLIFKPTPLHIKVTLGSGQEREYTIISGMTKTNFLISPLVENTSDFGYLFGGAELLSSKKVVSAKIYTPKANDWAWSNKVELTFSGFQSAHDDSFNDIFGISNLAKIEAIGESSCVGAVDSINGAPPPPSVIKVKGYLLIAGWNSVTTDAFPNDAKNIVLLTSINQVLAADAKPLDRPDVGKHFNSPSMANAGFSAIVDVRGLSGRYNLGIGLKRNGTIKKCPQFSYDVEL